jgi:ketosteroid isomerase-like protein
MTRSSLLLGILAMSILGGAAAEGQAGKGSRVVADAKNEVLQAEQSRNQALQKGDADALAKLYTDDLVYTNALGYTLTKEQHLADIRSGKLQLTALNHGNVEVRIHGNTGLVTGISTSLVNFHGNSSDSQRKFLNVYVKENGVWKCAVHFETPAAEAVTENLPDQFSTRRRLR